MKRMKDIKPSYVSASLLIPVLLNVIYIRPRSDCFLLGDEDIATVGKVVPVPVNLRVKGGVAYVEDGIRVGDEHGAV